MYKFRGSRFALAATLLTFGTLAIPAYAADDGPAKPNETKPPATRPAVAIAVEPVSGWISERTIPEATNARVEHAQEGIAHLLADTQYRTRADGHDAWFRWSGKVVNRTGLETAGQISLTYNPAFEEVGVHFIHLIRDGKVIDLTDETQFRVVERENDLADGIISGTLKAIAELRDVRVGDVIDYAMTTHTRTTLWPNQTFYHFSQRYSDPLAMRSLRLVWPGNMTAQYRTINSDVTFATRKTAVGTEWEWIAHDPPALQSESNVPTTAYQWGRVDVSTMRDWAELARWAIKIYEGDDNLPDDFVARLDAIARAWPAPGDRLTEATRYVQDNIRYVGEELGEGSYVPRRPRTVLTRGYGDCKDKALLLAVALRQLGIDAVPALVSSDEGARLSERLPSPLAFDLVIVRAVIDGKVTWVDATGSHRGGRGLAMVPADFGYALPVRAGQDRLETIEGFGERAGRMTVLEQFSVDEAAEVPLTLHVETRYTGVRADWQRSRWAATSAKMTAEGNLDFYHKRFPGLVESKPLQLVDNRDGNALTMVEDYTMPREAFVKAKIPAKLITRAYALGDVLPERQASQRQQPLAVSGNLINEQTIELRVKDRTLDTLDDIESKAGSVSFIRRTERLPDGLRMVYRLDTGSRAAVPAGEAEAIFAIADQIADELGVEFYLEKSARNVGAPTPKGIDAASWDAIQPEMAKIAPLMGKTDEPSRLEALSLIAELSAKVAHPSPIGGLIDGLKAAILSDLGRSQAAFAALQSATAQYDGNPPVFRVWIGYEIDLGTAETVAAALKRTRQTQPEVVASLDKRWVRAAFQKVQSLPSEKREKVREDMCIALAGAGWQLSSRTDFGDIMLGCAIAAHSLRGELAEARAGLAREPNTNTLLTLAIDRRHHALWPEIDRLGGDGFRKTLERDLARATVAAKAAPRDYAAITGQMQALRALGRYEEAVAAGKALAGDQVQIEVTGHDAFWQVNEYAENLRMLGQLDEAIAAMDRVMALGTDRYPELVSLEINRVEMVVAAGKYQTAVDILTEIEAKRFDKLNIYGKMWVWANKACALRAMGRENEANDLDVRLANKPDENWNAATAAAACRKDVQAIANMLVTRLTDNSARPGALGLFIKFDAPEAHSPLELTMRQVVADARAMPAVKAAFAKYGRAVRYSGSTKGWSEF